MSAVATHLANTPTAGVLFALVAALILFIVAGVMAALTQSWYAALTAAGLALVALAFLIT